MFDSSRPNLLQLRHCLIFLLNNVLTYKNLCVTDIGYSFITDSVPTLIACSQSCRSSSGNCCPRPPSVRWGGAHYTYL